MFSIISTVFASMRYISDTNSKILLYAFHVEYKNLEKYSARILSTQFGLYTGGLNVLKQVVKYLYKTEGIRPHV